MQNLSSDLLTRARDRKVCRKMIDSIYKTIVYKHKRQKGKSWPNLHTKL